MPAAPILNLGARWRATDIYWRTAPQNGQLLGVKAAALRGPVVNFAGQSGIYILYANFTPIYVGQVSGGLFQRLKQHYLEGDFVGRWDSFTWFGFRRVIGGLRPSLSKPGVRFNITTRQLLDHLEAILIHGFEPPLNGQEGRFGRLVERYRQVRDDRLGFSDRALVEQIASAGEFLPAGTRITKSGWKKADAP